jgi:hypothetical protein
MRAILIDPKKQNLTEVQICDDDKEHQTILRSKSITRAGHLCRYDNGLDALYVSNDPYEDGDGGGGPQLFFFFLNIDHDPPKLEDVHGLGLAFGTDLKGNVVDLRISVEELRKRIRFGFLAVTTDEELKKGITVNKLQK